MIQPLDGRIQHCILASAIALQPKRPFREAHYNECSGCRDAPGQASKFEAMVMSSANDDTVWILEVRLVFLSCVGSVHAAGSVP